VPTPTPEPTPTPPPSSQGCNGDSVAPSTRITSPPGGSRIVTTSLKLSANATDNVGVVKVEFYYHLDRAGTSAAMVDPPHLISAVKNPPYSIVYSVPSTCGALVSFSSRAYDACDNVGVSADAQVSICNNTGSGAPASLSWTSLLDVAGGEGQVIVDAATAVFHPAGRSGGAAAVAGREVRIEAVLVRAAGRPGTWQLDFAGRGVRPGGLRVESGQAASVREGSVRIPLRGTAGERIVLTLTLDP